MVEVKPDLLFELPHLLLIKLENVLTICLLPENNLKLKTRKWYLAKN